MLPASTSTRAVWPPCGRPLPSAAAVARACEILLTSLPSAAALDDTVAGAHGLLSVARKGQIIAELSTLPIAVKERNYHALAAAGMTLLDCPLSGTGAQAVTRDLAVFASGERAAFDRAAPVFAQFARVSHYLGAFGNGSRMKFVANLLVAIHNVATAEAMVLGIKAGLDPETITKVIASGAGNSRVFELRAPLMAARHYEPPSMKIDVWQKDMAIIAGFAADLGVATPLFSASAPVYDAAVGLDLGGKDTAAARYAGSPVSGTRPAALMPAKAHISSLTEVSPLIPTAPTIPPAASRTSTPPGTGTMRPAASSAKTAKKAGTALARRSSSRPPKPMPSVPHALATAISGRKRLEPSSRLRATRWPPPSSTATVRG